MNKKFTAATLSVAMARQWRLLLCKQRLYKAASGAVQSLAGGAIAMALRIYCFK